MHITRVNRVIIRDNKKSMQYTSVKSQQYALW